MTPDVKRQLQALAEAAAHTGDQDDKFVASILSAVIGAALSGPNALPLLAELTAQFSRQQMTRMQRTRQARNN